MLEEEHGADKAATGFQAVGEHPERLEHILVCSWMPRLHPCGLTAQAVAQGPHSGKVFRGIPIRITEHGPSHNENNPSWSLDRVQVITRYDKIAPDDGRLDPRPSYPIFIVRQNGMKAECLL